VAYQSKCHYLKLNCSIRRKTGLFYEKCHSFKKKLILVRPKSRLKGTFFTKVATKKTTKFRQKHDKKSTFFKKKGIFLPSIINNGLLSIIDDII
jgi:hypothetical protein